ncbi:MAG: 1-acyl-sn-glycerol-3-phosphate acyltransferase [bacterium]|nr:1-acyl-sn-glycerol-3-phosphate acyltransferase [bacterium]
MEKEKKQKRNYAKREEKEYNYGVEFFQRFAISVIVIPCIKLFYEIEIDGINNIPEEESFILAPTHTNYLDPLLAYYATKRPAAFMAKKELFDNPILGPLIVALGAFAVNREKLEIATIKTAQMIIKTKKWILSLFPQGGRDKAKKITKITPGFAYFARVAQSKVLPVSITTRENKRKETGLISRLETLFDDTPLFTKLFSSFLTYEIKIGKPIEYSKNLGETMEKWCDEICAISEYTVDEKVKQKIKAEKEKENESADSKS